MVHRMSFMYAYPTHVDCPQDIPKVTLRKYSTVCPFRQSSKKCFRNPESAKRKSQGLIPPGSGAARGRNIGLPSNISKDEKTAFSIDTDWQLA
ncbi:hypothetical protein NPIL_39581 [Nephila pilipes]|uniref:Uncharacterized protein n=1 Tax=Nephila pilipes TaxID=299642 RepID=A0A8X6QRR7_NEPPI|nr:hypothetical protein NPIL_39581 [Nephila pilipes]